MSGRWHGVGWGASILAVALLCATARAESSAPALFGLAIGFNRSDNPKLRDLRYADDDAVRNHALLQSLGAQAALLAELDPATRELYPGVRPTAPTEEALRAALTALNERIDRARRAGRQTVLYLLYSGHGDAEQGEGYVQLAGGRLTRSELVALLGRSRAHVNHVVVDACKSYFLAFERGPGGERRRAGQFLPPSARVPDNAGFLLSTSSAQDSHEWEAFQGGIFSHEVRSALRGAADLDGDGRVTYEEAAAFIYVANRAVPNRRFRPRFHARPQRGQPAARAVLVDLRRAGGRRVVVGPPLQRHFYIEDQQGVRLADLHPGRRELALVVPAEGRLFLRSPGEQTEYALPERERVVVAELAARRVTAAARGAEHEAFERLFAEPIDDRALQAYRQRPADALPERQAGVGRWLRPALGLFALGALVSGGVFTGLAASERADVGPETSNEQRQQINERIDRDNAIAVTAYVVGGVAAAGYLLWTFWPRPEPTVEISAGPGQLWMRARW